MHFFHADQTDLRVPRAVVRVRSNARLQRDSMLGSWTTCGTTQPSCIAKQPSCIAKPEGNSRQAGIGDRSA